MTLVDSLLENASKASFEALSLPLSLQKEYEKSSAKKIISNFEIDKQIASIMVLQRLKSFKKFSKQYKRIISEK